MYDQIILLGVLVSLAFTELTGLSAGLIVPGYLVLCLESPQRIAYTLALSLCAVGLCRLLVRVVILYGRRRFAVLLVLTYFVDLALRTVGLVPGGLSMIGVLIPGILAREFDRQGIADTLLAVTATTALLTALAFAVHALAGGQ